MTRPDDILEDFLLVSAALTGFTVADLHATGMVKTYLDTVRDITGDDIAMRLLTVGSRALRWPDDVERQLQLRVMDDKDLGPVARSLVVLWYTGGWVQLPADWRQRNGASTADCDRLLSARSYTEGLMWPAIGAHPQGAKPPGFASWVDPPATTVRS